MTTILKTRGGSVAGMLASSPEHFFAILKSNTVNFSIVQTKKSLKEDRKKSKEKNNLNLPQIDNT